MVNIMRGAHVPSDKEQCQLALCQRLIVHNSYFSQEEIRHDLQDNGYKYISQSTVSRLLKILGVIKMQNAKGQKIYALNKQSQPEPNAARTVAEMVISVEHNAEFVMIHSVAGYGRAVAKILDFCALPEILGVVAGSNIVWIAPREVQKTAQVRHRIMQTLGLH